MAYDEKFADRIRASLAARRYSERKMFGGLCFMVDGKMLVGISLGRLMVRVDPDRHEALLKRKHARPMDFTGRPMKGYLFVDVEGLKTPAQLRWWLDAALEFNPRAAKSKKRR